jgi:hypothetical protein
MKSTGKKLIGKSRDDNVIELRELSYETGRWKKLSRDRVQ